MLRFQVLFVVLPFAMVAGQTCNQPCILQAPCKTATCVDGECVYPNLPDGTLCIKEFNLGRCREGYCSISAQLDGCMAYGDATSCNADSLCSWSETNPVSCSNGGCPNANCAILSQAQISAGLTCANCFVTQKNLICGEGVTPTTGICQPKSTTGTGGCRYPHPIKLMARGVEIMGVPISGSALTKEHTETIEVGYLKDFSTVVAPGAPSGEVYRLDDNTIHKGDQVGFECPESCGKPCDVYVITYHCPPCQGSVRGNVVAAASAEGWEVSSCAPELYFGNEETPRPMITMRKVLQAGDMAAFPSVGDLNFVLMLGYSRTLDDCTMYDHATCETVGNCKYFNGQCITKAWCPKRFSKGPHVAPGPMIASCAAACIGTK